MSFKIPDSGKENEPCKDHVYYKWLLDNKITNIHTHSTRVDYLSSLGFILGVDWLSEEDLAILRETEEVYFIVEIRPLHKQTTDRWVCSKCGHSFGRHDMWFDGDVCGSCNDVKAKLINEAITKLTADLDNGKVRGLQGLLDKLSTETLEKFIDGDYDG
jgi:hypothetical protein